MDSTLKSRLAIAALFVVGMSAAGFVSDATLPAPDDAVAADPAPAPAAVDAAAAAVPAGAVEAPAEVEGRGAAGSPAPSASDAAPADADEALDVLTGSASYYANSLAGNRTASGVRYDPRALIAAHRTLPFGTVLRVTNLDNDRSVRVRVVDRGPFVRGRIIDLSRRAAEQIGMIRAGHAPVRVDVLSYGT